MGPPALNRLTRASSEFLGKLLSAISSVIRVDKQRLLISSAETEASTSGCEGFLTNLPLCNNLKWGQLKTAAGVLGKLDDADVRKATKIVPLWHQFQATIDFLLEKMDSASAADRTAYSLQLASIIACINTTEDLAKILKSYVDSSIEFLDPLYDRLEASISDAKVEGQFRRQMIV